MKILTGSSLITLGFFILQIREVQTETSFDILKETLTSVVPCLLPCFLDNIDKFVIGYQRECMSTSIIDQLTALSSNFGKLATADDYNSAGIIDELEKICSSIEVIRKCVADITRKHCGKKLGNQLEEQMEKMHEITVCGGTGKQAFRCISANSEKVREVVEQCLVKLKQDSSLTNIIDILTKEATDYSEIYRELLTSPAGTAPKICNIANPLTECLIDDFGRKNLPECSANILKNIDEEIKSVLDFINCRNFDKKDKSDALTCLGNPDLNKNKDQECVEGFDFQQPEKICGVVPYLDCIERVMEKETSCQNDGWTLQTYRAVTTPTRDYLINEHCQDLKEKASNDRGAGPCKNIFSDYTYGEPDPNYNASNTFGFSVQLLTTILTLDLLWILR